MNTINDPTKLCDCILVFIFFILHLICYSLLRIEYAIFPEQI